MKNNLSKFLVLSFCIVSITAMICLFFKADVHITHESFIGIIATFIGVIATFIVGFQIYNVMENNTKLEKYESSQKELRLKILQNKEIYIEKLNKLESQINTNNIEVNQLLSKYKYEISYLKSQLDLYTPHIKTSDWNSLVSTILTLDRALNNNVEKFAQFLLSEIMTHYLDMMDSQLSNRSIEFEDNLYMSTNIINKFYLNLKNKESLIKNISSNSSQVLNQLIEKIDKLRTTTAQRHNSFMEKYGEYLL